MISGSHPIGPRHPHQIQIVVEMRRRIADLVERARVEVRFAQTSEDRRQIRLLVPYPARQRFRLLRVARVHQRRTDADNFFAFAQKLSRIERHRQSLEGDPVQAPLDLAQRVKARCGGNDNEEADRDKREEQPAPQSGDEPGERRERTHPRRPQRAQISRGPGCRHASPTSPSQYCGPVCRAPGWSGSETERRPGETHILWPPNACGTSKSGDEPRFRQSQPTSSLTSVIIAADERHNRGGRDLQGAPFPKILPKCRDRAGLKGTIRMCHDSCR